MLSADATKILAGCSLGGLGLALVVYVGILLRRSPFTPFQSLLFGLNFLLVRLLWRAEANGPLPIPPGQGAVIVCNHRSPIDPAFIYLATSRAVHWMVAKEYSRNPFVGWLLRQCETILVSRGGIDTAATKLAIRLAQNGGLVGLFPEGRINETDELLLPGRPGVALIALKARVPVVPCYIQGSPYNGTTWGHFFMCAKVRVQVGEQIDLSDLYGREKERGVLEELTKRLLREIARLAGHAQYQPRLAGRFYKPGHADL